jgi:hypothetical protein
LTKKNSPEEIGVHFSTLILSCQKGATIPVDLWAWDHPNEYPIGTYSYTIKTDGKSPSINLAKRILKLNLVPTSGSTCTLEYMFVPQEDAPIIPIVQDPNALGEIKTNIVLKTNSPR